MSVKIQGLKELQKTLKGIKKSVSQQSLAKVVRMNAAELERNAKRNTPVKTGALQRSITTEYTDNGTTAAIGPYMDYAQYVELGTRFMQAQPYMQPAANQQAPIFARDIAKLVKK